MGSDGWPFGFRETPQFQMRAVQGSAATQATRRTPRWRPPAPDASYDRLARGDARGWVAALMEWFGAIGLYLGLFSLWLGCRSSHARWTGRPAWPQRTC
jgi:hypothetical protein